MKYTLFVSSFLLSTFLSASLEEKVSLLECKMDKVRDEMVYCGRAGARFPGGRPTTTGYGLWATGEVLYWKTYEGGTDFAAFNTTALTNVIGDVKKVHFDWETGFRFGLSYAWPQDNWDLTLMYTRIKPEGSGHLSATGTSDIVPLLSPDFVSGGVTQANASCDIKYSTLDFEMGRNYFVSRYLFLRPHFGARGAWIHQKVRADYRSGENVADISMRNDFNGGGLRLGADSKWFLDSHWNFSFSSAFSSLWGYYKVGNQRTNTTSSPSVLDTKLSTSKFAVQAETLAGLGWETFFSDDFNHLSLLLAYELNYWWRQNQLFVFELPGTNLQGTRYADDLMFHGLTFNMQISF